MKKATTLALGSMILPLAAVTAQPASFELVPGVVVNPGGDEVFLMSPEGAVEKLSLSSGNVVWRSEEAAKPLGIHRDLLIAQVEEPGAGTELRIVLLDRFGAGAVRHQLGVELPAGVRARVDDGVGRSFAARAEVLNGVPYVSWLYRERYTKGVAPKPGEALTKTRRAAYRLETQPARLIATDPPAAAVEPLPATVRAWSAAETAAEPPGFAGAVVAATQLEGGPNSMSARIVLKRWDRASGVPLPDVELFLGPYVLQFRSVDGRHLLVTERVDPGAFQEYEWSVFSMETGERMGQLRHHQSLSRFFVAGRHIVLVERPYGHRVAERWVEEPRKLLAVVLGSGAKVWERPLRDTGYRGPRPH